MSVSTPIKMKKKLFTNVIIIHELIAWTLPFDRTIFYVVAIFITHGWWSGCTSGMTQGVS
jgi:hypothetical protein